jgi:secondary thiamine-phosphate synthase enzyme
LNSEFHSNRIEVQTHDPFEYVDITEEIRSEVKKSEMANGIVLVNVLHTTAAVVIQEADLTVHEDAKRVLERLIPCNGSYEHSYEGTVNGSAHQRQQMLGNSCTLPVKDGILVLGTWQKVFLVELFRPMIRHVQITMLGCFRKEESQ